MLTRSILLSSMLLVGFEDRNFDIDPAFNRQSPGVAWRFGEESLYRVPYLHVSLEGDVERISIYARYYFGGR